MWLTWSTYFRSKQPVPEVRRQNQVTFIHTPNFGPSVDCAPPKVSDFHSTINNAWGFYVSPLNLNADISDAIGNSDMHPCDVTMCSSGALPVLFAWPESLVDAQLAEEDQLELPLWWNLRIYFTLIGVPYDNVISDSKYTIRISQSNNNK